MSSVTATNTEQDECVQMMVEDVDETRLSLGETIRLPGKTDAVKFPLLYTHPDGRVQQVKIVARKNTPDIGLDFLHFMRVNAAINRLRDKRLEEMNKNLH
jgi:hypothetical protein